MIKNNLLFVLILTHIFCAQLYGMEKEVLSKPKSLCESFEIPESTSGDIKNLLGQEIIGAGGWWYPDAALPHGCYVGAVAIDTSNNQLLTGDEKGRMRRWDLANYTEVSTEKEQTVVVGHGMRLLGELNKLIVTADSLQQVAVFDKRISIEGRTQTKRVIDVEAPHMFRRAFAHHDSKLLIVLASRLFDEVRHINGYFIQQNFIRVVNINTKHIDATFETERFKTPKEYCVGALAPGGKMFVISQGSRLRVLIGNFKKMCTLKMNKALVSALVFNQLGTMLAVGFCDGSLQLFDATLEDLNVGRSLCYKDYSAAQEIADVAFHPNQKLLFVATCQGEVRIHDFYGNELGHMRTYRALKEIALHHEGNLVVTAGSNCSAMIPGSNNAVIIWRKHEKPTLEQVLLRAILKRYFRQCIAMRILPTLCYTNIDDFVPGVARKFNLNQDELQATWQSMPEKLRMSIVNTVLRRTQEISECMNKISLL